MKSATLKKRLKNMGIPYNVVDVNGYNKDIEFTINETNFKGGIIEGKEEVQDFCREICYDKVREEMLRRFFRNFKELLRYAYA
jgi:hypothetical protein